MANNTLCVLKDRESPDLSRELEQQEDLSSWQLDLEGIQLVERGQLLAEKLAQSSRRDRCVPMHYFECQCEFLSLSLDALLNVFSTRAGLLDGVCDSRVDLEELHAQAERSR